MSFLQDIFGGGGKSNQQNFVDPAQQPFLDLVRNLGVSAFNQVGSQQQASGLDQAEMLSGQGQRFLGGLGQGAGQQITPFLGQGPVDQQIGALSGVLNRNLEQGLNSIQSRFGQSGSLGSRAGITGETALGDTQLALSSGTASILGNDINRQTGAAIAQGGLQAQSGLGALSQLGGLFNLSQAGFNNAFAPVGNLSQIIGGPTVLGEGSSSQSGGVFGPIGLSFGL